MERYIVNEIIEIQSELDRRTEIEKKAIELIGNEKYQEAIEILKEI